MKDVTQIIDQQFIMPPGAIGGELSVLIPVDVSAADVSCKAGELTNSQSPPSFQGPRCSISPASPVPRRIVEELVYQTGRRRNLADRESRFLHAFEAAAKAFMCVISRVIRNCKCILGSGIVAEIDQPLVYNLRPSLRCDVASQIDVKLAGDLEVVGGPGLPIEVATE